jgi:hypothetical protein
MVPNEPVNWRDRLDREAQAPPELRRRVISSLINRGLLSRPGVAIRRLTLLAAAIAIAFAAGVGVGRGLRQGATDGPGPGRYALLFYEGPEFDQVPGRHLYIAEYSAWAATLEKRKMLVGGHALDYPFTVLRSSADSVAAPGEVSHSAVAMTGFLIIRAASDAEAVAIARTCPHLRHHGTIEVRRLVGA